MRQRSFYRVGRQCKATRLKCGSNAEANLGIAPIGELDGDLAIFDRDENVVRLQGSKMLNTRKVWMLTYD
jgi:hypothetical protein